MRNRKITKGRLKQLPSKNINQFLTDRQISSGALAREARLRSTMGK